MIKLAKKKKMVVDLRQATSQEQKSFAKIVTNLQKLFGRKEFRLTVKHPEKISQF